MKFKSHLVLTFLCAAFSALFAPRVHGQGTAFTYQGFITAQGAPANGLHDFQFLLYDAATGGNFLGGFDMDEVSVTSGLFNVSLDFGSAPFNGQPRWLQIAVTATGGGQPLTTIAPRHALAPTPYAILAGTVPNGAITSSKLAAGAVTSASIGAGAITGNNLAAGAAAANLVAGGSAPVGGGGVILSEQSNNTNLLNTGYIKLGKVDLVPETWKQAADPSGSSFRRKGHTAVWTGSEMLVWGGYVGSNGTAVFLSSGWRYNPVTDSWTAISETKAPWARAHHTAVWTGTQMIVWGGKNSDFDVNDGFYDGGRYNPATDTWTATSYPDSIYPRYDHSAVWTGTEMIVWGGASAGYDYGVYTMYLNDGARYNPTSNTWTTITSLNAPDSRRFHTAIWTGAQMIVWGGDGGGSLASGSRYTPATDTWTATSSNSTPVGRQKHTAIWSGTEMLVWGGLDSNGVSHADGARYNPTSDTWTAMTGSGAPSARFAQSAIWTGSRMLVWGGKDANAVNSGASYNPTNNGWTAIPLAAAPAARVGHTTIWTGSNMVVWGGTDDQGLALSVGGRYNPTSNTWATTSLPAEASERSEHTAVWTGTEMLVFGGNGGGFVLGGGLRYNPATDFWAPLSASDAPSARRWHTAVWTGTEMLIWGGFDNANSLQSGGRYNPTANSWTAIPTNGAPSARQNHAAVWTGSEMIVWGGASGFVQLWAGNGGRFNPTSNTWATLSTNGAPSPRTSPSVAWTGTEMIVWGGYQYGGNTGLGDGARYNPGSNVWTAVSLANAPSPRGGQSTVWTGQEMIVWGGQNFTNYFNTGARYNPAADTWTSMSTDNAPSARFGHSAVWAGNQMIVVGCSSANPNPNSHFYGGSYLPTEDKWTSMTSTGAPALRYNFSAIWDGTEMLVWGGLNGSTFYKETWAYTPARSVYLYLKP